MLKFILKQENFEIYNEGLYERISYFKLKKRIKEIETLFDQDYKEGYKVKKIMFMVNGLSGGGAEKILQTLITLYSLHYQPDYLNLYPSDISYKYLFGYKKSNIVINCLNSILEKIKGKLFNVFPPFLFYFLYIKSN